MILLYIFIYIFKWATGINLYIGGRLLLAGSGNIAPGRPQKAGSIIINRIEQ